MTKRKPNLKIYQNKKRISVKVPGTVGIFRLLTWNKERNEYVPPKRGKVFFALRYELDDLQRKKRRRCYFDTLADARAWQGHLIPTNVDANEGRSVSKTELGKPLSDVIEEWRKRKYPTYATGTRDQYDKLIRLSLGSLVNMPIRSITPQVIDGWISELKDSLGQYWQAKTRKSFEKELTCLGVILRYYENYHDDSDFRFPIKSRHRKDIKLRTSSPRKSKDMPPVEFYVFREALRADPNGLVLSALATLQYFQALRISEAAALHWEDVVLDITKPNNSRLTISKHVVWSRCKGKPSFIAPGFKNSHALGGEKEMPLFPETFEALKSLYRIDQRGLVFRGGNGSFFSYKSIQNAYNRAFNANPKINLTKRLVVPNHELV